eukprot:TRINITY_DN3407_c0_g1_i1.p1 TRINITY_DN3407_c0_g1~~TRINITY_DN3407_c0_g1_i1.p1  ORF type:complete len:512 (+),score=185.02 TRINITY_DN3407_c0_g1_i1:179-1714(+)
MGAKFSKTVKGEKSPDGVVDESSNTFDKTSTLPATFKKKDEEVNKAGTLPRGGLDRSTSFSKRFRKSMTRLVGHKKVNENAKPVTEPEEPIVSAEDAQEEDSSKVKEDISQEVDETQEEAEDDMKTTQLKARAQFFENMYNSKEPVNIPKPPRSIIPSPIEKVTEEDEVETVSVSVIGTPVVKLIDKHEEGNETQQETAELKSDIDAAAVEVVDLIVKTKQEMVTSTETEGHEEVNDQQEVQLVNDNSGETVTAEPVEEKIIESITGKLESIDEVNVTCTADDTIIEQDMTVELEQKVEHPEKVECEDNHDKSIIEGVNSENEVEKDEQPELKESGFELSQEEKVENMKDEKTDLVIEEPATTDACTKDTTSREANEDMDEDKPCENAPESDTIQEENENQLDTFKDTAETEDRIEEKESNNETFEIVTSDMIDDMEESGASSLESKCDSRVDDLSSEGSSEGGITTDEGIVASDDEEKDTEDSPKLKVDITEEKDSLAVPTESSLVTSHE